MTEAERVQARHTTPRSNPRLGSQPQARLQPLTVADRVPDRPATHTLGPRLGQPDLDPNSNPNPNP
eukprot:scaffold8230_cov35-Phaeocystis_antarctica.AAC.1